MPNFYDRFASLVLTFLVVVSGIGLSGCEPIEYRPSAVGREGEIVIVMDSTNWAGELGESVRNNIAPYLGTLPAPEREFELKHVTINSQKTLEGLQKQKNVIFIAPLSDETAEARFLQSRLDEKATQAVKEGGTSVISRRDLWRKSQQIVYLLGDTSESLIDLVSDRGEDVRYVFNLITRERVGQDMFKKGRQPDIEANLMRKHGFAVNAQHDYFSAIDSTNFVWIRRVVNSDSWRSLFVYYVEDFNPENLTPEWVYAARERLTETWIQGNMGGFIAIDFRRELNTENIDFLGHFAYETRGLWHMIGRGEDGKIEAYGMGGPFVNYTFYDETSRRLYMIDGMVFAPGYDKREFLRQMEVISHTFRTIPYEGELDEPES